MKKYGIALLMGMVVVALLSGGCQTTPKVNETDLLKSVVAKWSECVAKKDFAGAMALYSPNFKSMDYENREALKAFLDESDSMGYFESLMITTDGLQYKVEKGVASVYPVELSGAFGSATIGLTLTKETGNWLITNMNVEQH